MASSNILLFDANKANMMSDEQYNTHTQRLNGVQSGIASSQLQNKTLYQCSLVAYAIAQVMNQNGLDANDTAAVSAFVANLSGTMLQKVADIASTQEAQAGVVNNKWMSPALVKAAMDVYTSGKWLPLAGGTMQGNLILNADPAANLGAATKQYVDNRISENKANILYNQDVTYKVVSGIVQNTNFNISGFSSCKLIIANFQNLQSNTNISFRISWKANSSNSIRIFDPGSSGFPRGQFVETLDVLNLSYGLTNLTDQFVIHAETYQGNSGNYKIRITMYKIV